MSVVSRSIIGRRRVVYIPGNYVKDFFGSCSGRLKDAPGYSVVSSLG